MLAAWFRNLGSDLGFEFRVSGSEFRVSGFGFLVSGFEFSVPGFGFRVSGFEFRVPGFVSRFSGLGVRVKGGAHPPASGEGFSRRLPVTRDGNCGEDARPVR